MSSMFNEAFENMFQQYINEIVAVGLFSVGYYIFQKVQPCENILEEEEKKGGEMGRDPEKEKESERVVRFNQYLRDSMYQRSDFEPQKLLKDMKEQGINADSTTYNTLMNICVEQGMFGETEVLFQELMGQEQIGPNIITFNVLLKQLVHMSMRHNEEEDNEELLQRAHGLLHEMKENKLNINFISYNTVLDLYVRVGQVDQGVDYLIKIVTEDDFQPDMFCYTTLIRGIRQKTNELLQQDKDIHSSLRNYPINQNPQGDISLDKMITFIQLIHDKYQHQIEVEQILFSCLIDLAFKMNHSKVVIKLVEEMKRQNITIKLVTYGILIKGFGSMKNGGKVQEYYMELLESGLQINEATLGCLVNALVRNHKQTQAYDLVQAHIEIVNTIIYTTLLTGFAKKKDKGKVAEIFRQMQESVNARPNLVTFNALMDSLIVCGDYEGCAQRFHQLEEEGFEPDIISYSTYLKGLCRSKQSLKAYSLYLQVKEDKKYKLDEVFFNLLLDGLGKDKQYEKAKQVYRDMQSQKVKAGIVTYSILIKFNSSINNLEECHNLWGQIQEQQLKPSLICYTCMIQVCIKQKKIEDMMRLYSEMKSHQVQPDQIFYNSLLSGLIFNRATLHMLSVLLETIHSQFLLGTFIYNNAIKLLSDYLYDTHPQQDLLYDHLLKILNFVRTHQVDIDDELYSRITNQMCKFQINSKITQNQTIYNQTKQLPKDYTFNRNFYTKKFENQTKI